MARIILLDDRPELLQAAARILRRAGHSVVVADKCEAALAHQRPLRRCSSGLDLPDGNGLDVGRVLLSDGRAAAVIFFTGAEGADVHRVGPVVAKPHYGRLLLAISAALRQA